MLGEFRVTQRSPEGVSIICFGPRNLAQSSALPRQAGLALWLAPVMADKTTDDLANFLNAALAASHGDLGPLEKLLGEIAPKSEAA